MRVHVRFNESDERIPVGFRGAETRTTGNYEELSNKPSINGVTLVGDLSDEDLHIHGGADFPEIGSIGDILMKTGSDRDSVGWITPASSAQPDNTRPITSAAVYTEIGNINALLATI